MCRAVKYSFGNSEHSNKVVEACGRILSTNTRFPGKTKMFSLSVAGRSRGLAGESTTGRSTQCSGAGVSATLVEVYMAGDVCVGDSHSRDKGTVLVAV